jgi:hypothetical protein
MLCAMRIFNHLSDLHGSLVITTDNPLYKSIDIKFNDFFKKNQPCFICKEMSFRFTCDKGFLFKIHRFHLRLGYDALTACFLIILVGGRTAPLLPQYCSSSFFTPQGCLLIFHQHFLNVGGGPFKKTHRKVV